MTFRSVARRSFMIGGVLFAAVSFWGLNALRINLNASGSMADHAYVMWTWPQTRWRGMVIAAAAPDAYARQFEGLFFTKRIVGLPGDLIEHRAGNVCVAGECFPLAMQNGRPYAPPVPEGPIPDGFYAAFGTSPDSLDSRYATIGLFSRDRILATGFGTNLIPHWTELKSWADARGQ